MPFYQHRLHKQPGDIEEPFKSGPEDTVPVIVFHPKQQIVPAYSGIVYQHLNISVRMFLHPPLKRRSRLHPVPDIETEHLPGPAGRLNHIQSDLGLLPVGNVIHNHMISFFCKPYAHGPSDSAAASCN